MKKVLAAVAMVAVMAAAGSADAALVAQWDLTGKSGSEVYDAATYAATNVTGVNLTKTSGLTGNAAANGFGSTGWNTAGQYYQFGFSVAAGYQAKLTDLWIGTRSSGTGPGSIGVYGSFDNFAHQTLLTTFAQPSAVYLNSKVDLTSLTAITGTYLVRLQEIGSNSAAGGTTAGTGTFRMSNYYDGTTYTPTGFNGDVTPAPTPTPTPIPAAAWLLGSGLMGLAGIRRRNA
jgi:hypothetical protein